MRGGTLLGFLVGGRTAIEMAVVEGMRAAGARVPWADRSKHSAERGSAQRWLSGAPDPKVRWRGKARRGGAPAATAPAPSPGAATGSASSAAAPASASAPIVASAPSSSVTGASPGAADAQGDASYLLQAGAFRASSEAESMKARLALIGFEARVLDAQVNGQTLYRVRVGPYSQLDSMNRARAKLAENGIEASVVRQR